MFGGYSDWEFGFVDFGAKLGLNSRGKPGGITRGALDKIGQHAECSHCVLRTYCIQKPPSLDGL
jgi:hypothetical protein